MKIRLSTLFILVAIAAAVSSWLATRQTPRFPGALIQIVDPIPPTRGEVVPGDATDADFADSFYKILLVKLEAQHPEIFRKLDDPNAEIRQLIRLQMDRRDVNTTLVAIQAWGNPLTGDDEALKRIMQSAMESLELLRNNRSGKSIIKVLNLPRL